MTTAARLSLPALVGWIAIASLTALLLLATGGYDGIYTPTLRALNIVLAAGALLVWVLVAWRRPPLRRVTVLWPALLVALVAMGLSTVGSSAPRLSLEYLAYAIVLAALYAMLVALLAQEAIRVRFGALMVVLCGLIAVAFIASAVGIWLDWWSLVGRITTPPLRPAFQGLNYGNPSAVMTIVLLLLASAVAHLGFGSRTSRLTALLMTALAFAVTVISGSRAGWLAVAIALGLTSVAWLLPSDHRATIRSLASDRLVKVAAGSLGLAASVAALAFGPGILLRFGAGGEAMRTGYYAASLRMFEDAPLVGQGLGTWSMRRIANTLPSETDYYIPHAHNIYFQTIAELGVVGVIAGFVVLGFLAVLIWHGIRDVDPRRRRFGWAAFFAITYFGVHQLLDFYANMPAALLAFAFPIAWLDATSRRSLVSVQLPPVARRIAVALAVVAIAASTLGLLVVEVPASQHRDAVQFANAGRWEEALPLAREAAERDPDVPAYQFTRGLAEVRAGNLVAAERALLRAAEADQMPVAWLDLAWLRLNRGDRGGAVDALAAALRLGRQQPLVAVNAALMWEELGDHDQALDALTEAVLRAPTLASDTFWREDVERNRLMGEAVAEASKRDPYVAFQIALALDDLERARAYAVTAGVEPVVADRVIRAWGDKSQVDDLYRLPEERPLTAAVEWAVTLASRYRDDDALDRFRRWAVIIEGPIGSTFGVVRTIAEPEPGQSLVDETGYYGQYTYRRAIPWDHVLPGMVRLVR
jgi:tetratricopeptide (TPR) repeat protein/O-antigen ligase